MGTKSISRRQMRAIRQREAQRRRRITLGTTILVGSILIALAGWSFWTNRQASAATFNYGSADIAHDRPLHAVHEMGAGPPIPFLPKGEPQPRIAIDVRYFNFGSIGPYEIVSHEFVIANLGDAPLTISRAYTTCGCTTADFTSALIPPGKVAIVTLTVDAGFHDVRGQIVRRGLIIENNDPRNPSTEIWVQASVRFDP